MKVEDGYIENNSEVLVEMKELMSKIKKAYTKIIEWIRTSRIGAKMVGAQPRIGIDRVMMTGHVRNII
jgi:hypothetical protein